MATPENTTKRDALDHFAGMLGGTDRYITDMEAAGQRQLLASTTLPVKANHNSDVDFEALGFTFGQQVDGDPMFREATLPEGWKREGSEHAMWSYIVDQRDIRRVSIFYKAAFYDREAFMGITNVGYEVATKWIYGDDPKPTLHPHLTAEELEGARESASRYLKDADEYPPREDRTPRARSLFTAATVALALLKGGE